MAYIPRHELRSGPLGSVLGMDHEYHVREAGPEVGAVSVVVPRGLGRVHVHAARTVQLHHRLAGNVR